MTETSPNPDSAPESAMNGRDAKAPAAGAEFSLQKIYTKDVSFESPRVPDVFLQRWEGKTNVQLDTTARQLQDKDDLFEVELRLTVTTENDGKAAYLCELKQAGVFMIRGFDPAQQGALLGAYCPNVLFSFAREAIADLVQKGGFPQLLLQPVNFDALYQQHLQSQQAQAAAPRSEPPAEA